MLLKLIAVVPETRHESRVTPMSCGNVPGSKRSKKPKKAPGNCCATTSYARAIRYACKKAGIEVWGPNRLRHTALTIYRKEFGLESASVVAGHSQVGVTQVDAEADRAKAIEAVRRFG
ncbi:MAG: hypothetical protein NTW52_19775 [Planctomycetota bacterium]|nr:hypothetical protein [Planctomycetota bacterium]